MLGVVTIEVTVIRINGTLSPRIGIKYTKQSPS